MRTFGAKVLPKRCAALDRSNLMTSEGQEPTKNRSLISGRRSSNCFTTLSSSSLASARPAKSRSSIIAVANRGSAKIITPAAD